MKRTALAVILAALAPLASGQADDTGALPVRTPDRSTTCTLDSLNDTCAVALEGRHGVGSFVTTANLNASIVAEVSNDGGATWLQTYFVSQLAGLVLTQTYTGGASEFWDNLYLFGGHTHVRLRVSIYVSGTATATIKAQQLSAYQTTLSTITQSATARTASIRDTGANDALNVALTDSSGNQQGSTANPLRVRGEDASSANNDGACVSVTASTTVLASFATRKAFTVFARETNTDLVYIKMGATATSADFPLPAGSAYNMQAGVVYTGVIDAIAASGTQSVCVIEF